MTEETPAVVEQQQVSMEIEKQLSVQDLQFVCESDGYRYYKQQTDGGRQYCMDAAGYWYVLNEKKGAFEPMGVGEQQQQEKQSAEQQEKAINNQAQQEKALKNVERFGIRFDQNGKPIYPKNEKGLFILPKDEKGSLFFPVDDRGTPIFPWDYDKGMATFPVDDTDEPIFPRNDHNKPIVPKDSKGEPIFPIDKLGTFIFPLDESNCPIPALTVEGISVVPKDEYGNLVIPQDREGKPLIHIASDGVTPISAAEWKQWKKYYKEQARTFYQQQQLQSQMAMNATNTGTTTTMVAGNYPINSMFHPLNLEQQSAYFAADMEMLQRVRRVRPEDVDLPGHRVEQHLNDAGSNQKTDGSNGTEEKQEKRKKFLQAQLKAAKKVTVVPLPIPKRKSIDEEPKMNGIEPRKEVKMLKGIDEKLKNMREMKMEGEENSRKRKRDNGDGGARRDMHRQREASRSPKRRRRHSSPHSSSSASSSPYSRRTRSRSPRSYSSHSSHSRRGHGRRGRQHRRQQRSSSYSSRSRSSSRSSYSSRSSRSARSRSRSYESGRDEEEERIRDRIIARTHKNSTKASQPDIAGDDQDESMEYGPKPPESLQHSEPNSDMEMSEDEQPPPPPAAEPSPKRPEKHEEAVISMENAVKEPIMEREEGKEEIGKEEKEEEEEGRVADDGKEEKWTTEEKKAEMKMDEKGEAGRGREARVPNDQLNVKEVLKSNDIELIKQCKEQQRERYDELKMKIAELEVEKSVHKRNWTELLQAEKRLEVHHRTKRSLSSSEDDVNSD